MKELIQFLLRDVQIRRGQFLLLAVLSGLANAAVLAIINVASANAEQEVRSHRYLVLFMIAVAVFIIAQKRILATATREVERVIHKIRVRVLHEIRGAELAELEEIGRAELYSAIRNETAVLSDATVYLVIAFQAGILVIFVMGYIATLSLAALFLNLLFTAVGAGIHLRRSREIQLRLAEARREENRLHEGLTDMLDGFKEVKINRARGDELLQWVEQTSEAVTGAKTEAQRLHAEDFVLSQVTFFVLTATMVFLVPLFGGGYNEVVTKTTAATLFLIGPISNVVTAIPLLARTQSAILSISALEQRLRAAQRQVPEMRREFRDISEIRFEGVTFRYDGGGDGFEVGPLDLTFRRGETVFISGGNGSGKTTLIRLLTGLYRPHTGRITVDGIPVGDAGIDSYRELFATVFSDYHLFKRLYGIHDVDQVEVAQLFRILELEDKTRLVDREFQSVDLSSGQRKRLALMVSVLEHKPITVFDEWAADQDPYFRRKFYTEILSWMKAQGATIIAVTHDDKYYDNADRTLVMREGRIVEGG